MSSSSSSEVCWLDMTKIAEGLRGIPPEEEVKTSSISSKLGVPSFGTLQQVGLQQAEQWRIDPHFPPVPITKRLAQGKKEAFQSLYISNQEMSQKQETKINT